MVVYQFEFSNHIGTKTTIVPGNRDHIEIYLLSMFLCGLKKFKTETLLNKCSLCFSNIIALRRKNH
jgi:hypothetical protein